MDIPWWIWIIIAFVVYAAILDFDNLTENPADQLVDTAKEIVNKGVDAAKGEESEDTTIEDTSQPVDEYIGKPRMYEEFDCTTDEHCNFNLDACQNECKCNQDTGECYIPAS